MIKGFRDFIARGNAVDLAVAFVVGAAFTSVVNALITGLIDPLVAAVAGEPNLDRFGNFTINNAQFSIGLVLSALLNFILVAAAVYFVVVVPMNKWNQRRQAGVADEVDEAEDIVLLREIRDALVARRDNGSGSN